MKDTLSALSRAARKAGWHTPIGRRLSMVAEQLKNGASPSQTIAEIEQIKRDGGVYIHEHHGAARS